MIASHLPRIIVRKGSKLRTELMPPRYDETVVVRDIFEAIHRSPGGQIF
jgi:hypothetical protein